MRCWARGGGYLRAAFFFGISGDDDYDGKEKEDMDDDVIDQEDTEKQKWWYIYCFVAMYATAVSYLQRTSRQFYEYHGNYNARVGKRS